MSLKLRLIKVGLINPSMAASGDWSGSKVEGMMIAMAANSLKLRLSVWLSSRLTSLEIFPTPEWQNSKRKFTFEIITCGEPI